MDVVLTTDKPNVMQSEYRNAFVYAVPRHCLNPRLRHNPYEIVAISRAALFDTKQNSSVAKWDYYTISASGFTFYPKNDASSGVYQSTIEWEAQRMNFEIIASKSTFKLFRYFKAFISWKKWIRTTKMENARGHLIVEGFFSNSLLLSAVNAIRAQLSRLDACSLEWDFRGRSVTMEQFAVANEVYLRESAALIEEIHSKIQSTLVEVARDLVDDGRFKAPESTFPGDQFAQARRKCSNYNLFEIHVERELKLATANERHRRHEHFHDASPLVANKFVKQRPHTAGATARLARELNSGIGRVRWTMAAAQRRKCSQLARFVRMVGFLELDTFEAVVRRNGEMVYQSVLRGSNAVIIRRLADPSVLDTALRAVTKDSLMDPASISGENASKPGKTKPFPLTKQQLKQFLRGVWDSAFRTVGDAETSTARRNSSLVSDSVPSSEIWDQSKFEVALCQALATSKREAYGTIESDALSVEDISHFARRIIKDALILQPFDGDTTDLYSSENATETDVSDGEDLHRGFGEIDEDDVPGRLRAIESIAPIPLFISELVVSESDLGDCEICVRPSLDDVILAVQDMFESFLNIFKALPSLVSDPILQTVLDFAEDLLASSLDINAESSANQRGSRQRPSLIQTAVSPLLSMDTDDGTDEMAALSIFSRLEERVMSDREYRLAYSSITELISSAVEAVTTLANRYLSFLELHMQNQAVSFDEKAHCFRAGSYQLRNISDDILDFQEQIRMLGRLKTSHSVQFIRVDVSKFVEKLLPAPTNCLETMYAQLPALAHERCTQLLDFISSSNASIQRPSSGDLSEFTQYLLRLQEVYDAIDKQESELAFIQELFTMLKRFRISIPEDTTLVFALCDPEFSMLRAHAQDAYASRESNIHGYTAALNERIVSLQQAACKLQQSAWDDSAFESESCGDSHKRLCELARQTELMVESSRSLSFTKSVFADISGFVMAPAGEFDELNRLASCLKLKVELWQVLCESDEHLESVSSQSLRDVDLERMTALSDCMRSIVARARGSDSGTSNAVVLGRLAASQRTFEALIPIIRDLRNPCMQERHWTKLERKMESNLFESESAATVDADATAELEGSNQRLDQPLKYLLEADVVEHAVNIRHVSEEATAEAAISEGFKSVWYTWEVKEIPIEQRKDRDGRDAFSVSDCDELIALMEESEVLLRVMDCSSYARIIQERLTKLLADLTLAKDTTMLLLTCQHRWDHTQQLLSVDFARGFPEQSKLLQKHDASWRAFMTKLSKRPLCLTFGVSAENRQVLMDIDRGFKAAEQALAENLELKRQVFPSFFRLSNAELATLLAKARDVHDIQPYLYQCFDNVGSIVFGTRDSFQDILSIISRAGHPHQEVIDMGNNLKARGPPEQWLSALEKRLVERLRRATKHAVTVLSHFKSAATDIKASDMVAMESLPLQSLLLADQIVRCEIINESIAPQDPQTESYPAENCSMVGEDIRTAFSALGEYSERLRHAVIFQPNARGYGNREAPSKTSKRTVMLISCLQLQEIQFRDALALHDSVGILKGDSSSKSAWMRSIPWELQLKYRLDDSTTVGHECHVHLNSLDVPYGFNYAEPSNAVVMTPTSMRNLFALSACIRNAQAVMLAGPSEAGKATLTAQVCSILGRKAFYTVVTPSTNYAHVARLLAGGLYSGGIFCAQFARVTDSAAAILKMLATQLAAIERAVTTGQDVSGVHRSPIVFTPGTALFVVHNTLSFSSHHPIDEVRAWAESIGQFEVVAADYEMILEALLSVNGFTDPTGLSKKLFLAYNQVRAISRMHSITPQGRRVNVHSLLSMKVLKAAVFEVSRQVQRCEQGVEPQGFQRFLLKSAILERMHTICDDEDTFRTVESIVTAAFRDEVHQQECAEGQYERETKHKDERKVAMMKWLHAACERYQFTARQQLINNALALSSHMNASIGTILVGACGTGKTTVYRVLSKAVDIEYQSYQENMAVLQQQQEVTQAVDARVSPTVKPNRRASSVTVVNSSRSWTTRNTVTDASAAVLVRVVLPGTLTLTQLYGSAFTERRKDAASSVLGRLIHEAQELYSSTAHANRRAATGSVTSSDAPQKMLWVVFDGSIETPWIETLMLALKSQHRGNDTNLAEVTTEKLVLPFENGEFMTVPPNMRLVFESLSLAAASPSVVTSNAILHLKDDSEVEIGASEALHRVFLRRFFAVQRKRLVVKGSESAEIPQLFDVIERRLLDASLLDRLQAVIDEYAPVVSLTCLQRVQSFVSMLQAVLHSILSSSIEDGSNVLVSAVTEDGGQPKDLLSLPIAMGLAYSLMWGFAACITDSPQLMLLVSNTVKSAVPEAAPAWSASGRDINLFETVADFMGMRFVHVDEALAVTAIAKTRGNSALYINPEQTLDSRTAKQPSSLFVPTIASLLTHAAMKEALRTGRMVLLVGGENTRRTTLLRHFIQQAASLRALLTPASNVKSSQSIAASSEQNNAQNDLSEIDKAKTLDSVNRIRFHQISLVMMLAARFSRESGQTAALNAGDKMSTTLLSSSAYSSVPSDATLINPTWTPRMAPAVQKLDSNNVIPFFFSMTQHDRGALDLAGCMERMLQRERAGVYEPPPGKAAVLLIDDLHLHLDSVDQLGEAERAEGDTQTADYPSCYEFLRSASEHSTVFTKDAAVAKTIENLFMVASTSLRGFARNQSCSQEPLSRVHHDAFSKLTQVCFPILTPTCSSNELCSLFSVAITTQMDRSSTNVTTSLATAVKEELPAIVAATVVLWERLRAMDFRLLQDRRRLPRSALFNLHDLARVLDAIGSADALVVADTETLIRLWNHECMRTFQDQVNGFDGSEAHVQVGSEIALVRDVLREVKHLAPHLQTTNSFSRNEGLSESDGGDKHKGYTRAGILHQLMQTALSPSTSKEQSATSSSKKSLARLSRIRESITRHPNAAGSSVLWAYVPDNIYYDHQSSSTQSSHSASSNSSGRRSSRVLLHRASFELKALAQSKQLAEGWVYAELVEDETICSEVVESIVQKYFGWVAISVSRIASPEHSLTSARWSLLSPDSGVPPVPLSLAHTIARIERVRAKPFSKLVLVGLPGSGRESLLHYINTSWHQPQRHKVLKLVGMVEIPATALNQTNSESAVATKWSQLLREIYVRVGMNCEKVTLIVKRLDLISTTIANQLLSLMTTGDVPGAFSLDDQIEIATKVRDERLIEIEIGHTARIAQIQSDVKERRDCEYALARQHEHESRQAYSSQYFNELDEKYRELLNKRLEQAQLQLHQETDDFVRQREVETESVTATIMSLMRPLGITSGKWHQIIDRIRRYLSVVIIVDRSHEVLIRAQTPQLFTVSSVVRAPLLNFEALRVLCYGHFLAEVRLVLREVVSSVPQLALVNGATTLSMDSVKPFLWVIAAAAAEMHLAVARECSDCKTIGTSLMWVMASRFAKVLARRSRDIQSGERKEQAFLASLARMDDALAKLRDSSNDLPVRIEAMQEEIATQQLKMVEQQETADRIRAIMLRFQEAAEEQVRITNEMQDQAQRELQIPLACVEEANAALLLIEKRHIVEIKSFTSPPLLVHLVLDAICVLFRYEPTWENARKILSDPNVVQTLLTFDKDAIPVEILHNLDRGYLSDERFNRQDVERQSVAASMMVVWVRAVHQYATARLLVKPALDKLAKAQSRLKLLMQEFQVSKDRVTEAETTLKSTTTQLAALEQQKQELVSQCDSRASKLEGGQLALEFVEEDRQLARSRLNAIVAEKNNWLAWWNALMDAGAVTYTGGLPYRYRARIFKKWKQIYTRWSKVSTSVDAQTQCAFVPSFTITPSRSINDEDDPQPGGERYDTIESLLETATTAEANLEQICIAGTCFSRRRLHDAFLLSTVATTPGLFVVMITEFNEHMERLIVTSAQRLWNWMDLQMVYARASDFDEVFLRAVQDGHQLLVIDVEPCDGVGESERSGLRAIFDWQVTETGGQMYLSLPAKTSNDEMEHAYLQKDQAGGGGASSSDHLIPISSQFKLVLASHLRQAAFGDSLDHIPVVNAELSPDEIQDVILDQLWASKEEGNSGDAVLCLDAPLRETVRVFRDQSFKHTVLVGLIEAAVKDGDFQTPQMERIRDQCNATKEGRLEIQQRLANIYRLVQSIRSRGAEIARVAAATFNAVMSAASSQCGKSKQTGELPLLALQSFLPLFFRALKPSPAATFVSPDRTPLTSPVASPRSKMETPTTSRSLRSTVNLTRQVSHLMALTRQGSDFDSNVRLSPAFVLPRLLRLLDPLVSTESAWQHLLARLYLSLEESRNIPVELEQSQVGATDSKYVSDHDALGVVEEAASNTAATEVTQEPLVSVRSILAAARIQQASRQTEKHNIKQTIQHLDTLAAGDEKIQLAATFLSSCIEQRKKSNDDKDDTQVMKYIDELACLPTRVESLQVGLIVLPELVPLLCQKVKSVSGGLSLAGNMEGSSCLEKPRNWPTVLASFPETTGVVLLTSNTFGSFSLLRSMFFGILDSLELQLAVLKHIAQQGCITGTSDNTTKVYQLPRSVIIAPDLSSSHNSDIAMPKLSRSCNLVLTLNHFQDMLDLEKKHIDTLEMMPMALINMSPEIQGPESWYQFFRILYRSFARVISVTHARGIASAIETAITSPSVPSTPLTRLKSQNQTLVSDSSSSTSPRLTLQKSMRTHRRESSSRSVLLRESEIALVTPSYPRLLGVVAAPDMVPRHFRKSVVCVQASSRRELRDADGESNSSFRKCLQATTLRIVYCPFGALLNAVSKTSESGKHGDDALTTPSNPPWPFRLGKYLAVITVFHAILCFRHEESMPTGVGFPRYSDDTLATGVNQLVLIIYEICKTADKQASNGWEDRCARAILDVYTRLAGGEWEHLFLEQLLHDCLVVMREQNVHQPEYAVGANISGLDEKRSKSSTLENEFKRRLQWLPIPATDRVSNLEMWLDAMWPFLCMIDRTMDSQLRFELFGVSRAFNAFDNGRGGHICPWVYEIGQQPRDGDAPDDVGACDGLSIDVALDVIQTILSDALPAREYQVRERETDDEVDDDTSMGEHMSADITETGSKNEFLDQIRIAMQDAYARLLDSIRRFFETVSERIEFHISELHRESMTTTTEYERRKRGTGDSRRQFQSLLLDDKSVFRQVVAVMKNQVPDELGKLLFASKMKHSVVMSDSPLDEVIEWIQSWHYFLYQHQQTLDRRYYRWWTPAVEAFEIPISHIINLSCRRVDPVPNSVMYSLRPVSIKKSASSITSDILAVKDLEGQSNGSNETLVVLDGLWLYGAAWNDEHGWLEPANIWRPMPVVVIGSNTGSDDRSTRSGKCDSIRTITKSEDAAPSMLPSGEEGCSPRLVPLLRIDSSKPGTSTCLAQWEIRASPALSTLVTPYLLTHGWQ